MTAKKPAQHRFDSMVKDHLAPLLKAAGFKKQGLNFRRRWGEDGTGGWHVINIQKSQWGNRDLVNFTVNLGLACDLYTRYQGRDPVKPPTQPECCWRERIGFLMPERHDH